VRARRLNAARWAMLIRTSSSLKGTEVTHSYCPLSLSGPHSCSAPPALRRIGCAAIRAPPTVEGRSDLAMADWDASRPQPKPAMPERAIATRTMRGVPLKGVPARVLHAHRKARLCVSSEPSIGLIFRRIFRSGNGYESGTPVLTLAPQGVASPMAVRCAPRFAPVLPSLCRLLVLSGRQMFNRQIVREAYF
jgi:hypothetical protein